MDSDDDDGFARQGGDALEMGDDFDDSEEEADEPPQAQMRKPMAAAAKAKANNDSGPAVKG
jgi:hypothetical protein